MGVCHASPCLRLIIIINISHDLSTAAYGNLCQLEGATINLPIRWNIMTCGGDFKIQIMFYLTLLWILRPLADARSHRPSYINILIENIDYSHSRLDACSVSASTFIDELMHFYTTSHNYKQIFIFIVHKPLSEPLRLIYTGIKVYFKKDIFWY